MEGERNSAQEEGRQRGDGDGLPLVVDSAEGTTLQVGQSNVMVVTHLPSGAEGSDIPQVNIPEVPSVLPDHVTNQAWTPSEPKVILTGKNTNAQIGHVNRAVITRAGDQVVQELSSPVSSIQPTTEAVQVSSALYSNNLGDNSSGPLSLQTDGPVSPSTDDQQTFPKTTEQTPVAPTTPLELNIPTKEKHNDMPSAENRSNKQGNMPHKATSSKDRVVVCHKKTQTYLDGDVSDDETGDDNATRLCFQQVHGDYIQQIGANNIVIDIQIDQGFLEEARHGGEVTVTPNRGSFVRLTWKGVAEAVESVKSLWTIKFSEQMENMQGDFLQLISHDIFSPLRKKVLHFFQKYDARLLEICNGSLVFVFTHPDEESAQRMLEDKDGVRRVFQRLMLGIGRGDVTFSLEAQIRTSDRSVDSQGQPGCEEEPPAESPESDPLANIPLDLNHLAQAVHSRIQQSSRDDRDKQTVENRLQSMEGSLQQLKKEMSEQAAASRTEVQRTMREMREFMMGAMLQGRQKIELNPVAVKLEDTLADLKGIGKLVSGKDVFQTPLPGNIFAQGAIAAYLDAIQSDAVSLKLSDDPISERNESQRDVEKDILDELSPLGGEEKGLNPDGNREAGKEESVKYSSQGKDNSDQGRENQNKESFESPLKTRKPRSEKMFNEAERLLSSLNVASVGRSSTNKEVKRLADAVAEALVDDDPPPPRAKTMDTLLCLDISESIGAAGLEEVKCIATKFVDGIQEIAEHYDLEENIGVITMGGGARVVQQLTNDYGCVRDAIETLEYGGTSPIFETLTVCVAAIKGRGGVLSMGGAHEIRPRIIFITDGLATNDAYETGPDTPSTDHNTKIQLIRLVGEFSPTEHSSTPNPIVWVPVGNADRSFLASLATLGGGLVVEGKDITTLCSYYRIQESVGKIYICVKSNKGDWGNLPGTVEAMTEALAADLQPEEKIQVIQAVKHKLENKEKKNPDSNPNDYDCIHEVDDLPPIGTRVTRGPDWHYDDQDTGGPGTVVNHAKDDHLLWVLWDLNDTVCRYRFGYKGKYDVFQADDQPRILMQDELIEIGVKVKRGPDWPHGDRDGGPDEIGVVVRKRKDGKVKVRWPNGTIKSCRYGYDGKFDLTICELDELMETTREQTPATATQTTPQSSIKGGHEKPTKQKPHVLWQWKDDFGQWRLYDREHIEKLNKEFDSRPEGSCVLQKDGKDHRVMFREMFEKYIKDGSRRAVQRIVVGDEDRDELVCMEISLNEDSPWAKFQHRETRETKYV